MIKITIKEFKNEYNFSMNAIKYLFSEAKKENKLEFFDITIFVDSNIHNGIKRIYKIDFIHNNVVLIYEDEYANYNIFEKYDDY